MLKNTRSICLDVCDYENNAVCNLYDNTADASGQATDVFVRTERNGWKELSFRIPSTCFTDEGEETNYRLQYLIADYRLRVQTDKETDWYLISEPKITHEAKSKYVDVVAGHISQLLKNKNLSLEFSDEEGNNVGTAEELLTTILEGTGWFVGNISEFLEDDGNTVKVRSIEAPARTGALKLISTLCDKFNAKPVYHGDSKTVDLVPMNPFSETADGEIPEEVLAGENVLELHYGANVKDITRTLNTENIVTRLYAYGAYGDKTNGLCSLQTVTHAEYKITISESYPSGTEFCFTGDNDYKYYFVISEDISAGHKLVWSMLDQASRSYVWNNNTRKYYPVKNLPQNDSWINLSATKEDVQNKFDYLMDFGYYDKIGLLSDSMKQAIAEYQRDMPAIVDASTAASSALIESEEKLSRIAESNTGFLRLDVSSFTTGTNGELILNLRKTNYEDGIIYRSDYDQARRNYFSWYCAEALKDNGDPTSGIGSVVYIIRETNPVTWFKAYIKEIDGEVKTQDYSIRGTGDPDTITLWLTQSKIGPLLSTDRIYLFSTNSISGQMGVRESELESMQQSLQSATKVVTEQHPTYYVWDNDIAPSIEPLRTSYGWYYRSFSNSPQIGELYFCYGLAGETSWKRTLISETDPAVINGGYYFNLKSKNLFHGESNRWINIADSPILVPGIVTPYYAPNAEARRLSQSFSKVAYYCLRYDMLHKGLYQKYVYTAQNNLDPGNYAFRNDYGFYWVFTTDLTISKNKTLWIDTEKYLVYQNENTEDVVKPEAKPYESIDFPVANELSNTTILQGSIIKSTGVEENSTTRQRTNHIPVYAGIYYQYSLPANTYVLFYDSNRRFLSSADLNTSGSFFTPVRSKYARLVFQTTPSASQYLRVNDWQNKMFIKEQQYTILSPLTTSGEQTGFVQLIKGFADTADDSYLNYLKAYQAAQKQVEDHDNAFKNMLGDLYRESRWQENEFVEGDEDKLYRDALDNLDKISKPEATYDVGFLDLYASNHNIGFSTLEELEDIEWPDIEITDAVHLIDEDIDVNCWAFIDKVDKCYDKPWQTTITINTDLSLINQHDFTDVLARIAEVANETKSKQTIYKRAAAISGTGAFTANKLEGTINANKALLLGGSANWYTDPHGRMIFESADGQSAMMLTGAGFAVANSKDEFGDWDWRTKFTIGSRGRNSE